MWQPYQIEMPTSKKLGEVTSKRYNATKPCKSSTKQKSGIICSKIIVLFHCKKYNCGFYYSKESQVKHFPTSVKRKVIRTLSIALTIIN